MSVPHLALTDSQRRLLAELMLSPLTVPADEVAAVARGLAPDQLQVDVPALQWMGLIVQSGGSLSVTAQGTAVFHRAEQEKAECRLTEVAAFADVLEKATDTQMNQRRIAFALRRLAQGECSWGEAVDYVLTSG
ncbi:hypothetical protein [Streptomyces sp. NPDC005131]